MRGSLFLAWFFPPNRKTKGRRNNEQIRSTESRNSHRYFFPFLQKFDKTPFRLLRKSSPGNARSFLVCHLPSIQAPLFPNFCSPVQAHIVLHKINVKSFPVELHKRAPLDLFVSSFMLASLLPSFLLSSVAPMDGVHKCTDILSCVDTYVLFKSSAIGG